jgi:uncharacterized membrane protein YeiB
MGRLKADLGTRPARAGPVLERERILALDLLRGFAVLGILVMNIQGFAEFFAAYQNPMLLEGRFPSCSPAATSGI